MKRRRTLTFGLAFAATIALLMAMPGDLSSYEDVGSFLGVQEACAQARPTGTCKDSLPDICFVEGEPYDNREWVD